MSRRDGRRRFATGGVHELHLLTQLGELGFSLRLQERPGPDARNIPARTWKYTAQVARFHLRDLTPGSYDLHVLQQGKVIGKLERITIRPGEEAGPVGITGLE